jgi:hypothetical protein
MSLTPMKPWSRRPLTSGERAALSPGLAEALDAAGVVPRISARPSIPALVVGLWRRRVPVMVLGGTIYWPRAAQDFSTDPLRMSVLQHELQHVLEFADGTLSRFSYVARPRNWIYPYRLRPGATWDTFGAEQRAMMVQDLWLAERGLLQTSVRIEELRALIPWAR